ncbi:MAG: carbon-nitrogen hydrolase family protein [Thermoplasmataceae archaeon]
MAVKELVRFTGIQAMRMSLESATKFISLKLPGLASSNPDLIVLPEKWIVDSFDADGEPLEALMGSLIDVSGENTSVMIPGSLSIVREGKLYNSAPVIDRGKVIGWQDKISPFRNEVNRYSRGGEVRIFDTSIGRICVPVCYDIDFPYFLKVAIRGGANFAINPSLIDSQFLEEWHLYISVRSLENRIPVLSVNSLSSPFNGNSLAVQPYLNSYGFRVRKITAGVSESFKGELDGKGIGDYMAKRAEEDPGIYGLSRDKSVQDT